jgi:hypothetical protein
MKGEAAALSVCAQRCQSHYFSATPRTNIQGHSGRKFNIFGGDSVGSCEKEVYLNMCLVLNAYQDRAV